MSNVNLTREFREFGKNIYVVAICMILGIIPYVSYVTGIVSLVFMIMALKSIKNISMQMKNENLEEFRKKIIVGMVLRVIATMVLAIGLGSILPSFIYAATYYGGVGYTFESLLGALIAVAVTGLIIMIAGAVMEMKAWENLNIFFTQNASMFPQMFSQDAMLATNQLRRAALCYALFILIIPIIIGFILYIVGYFKLSKLKDLPEAGQGYIAAPASVAPSAPASSTAPVSGSSELKFCPNCGSPLKPGVKFCGECGSKLA